MVTGDVGSQGGKQGVEVGGCAGLMLSSVWERKGRELAELNDGLKRREWGLHEEIYFTKSF